MPDILRLDILRALRAETGITQEGAARLCGLTGKQSRLTFSQWESGTIIPRAQRRGRVLTYLWDHLALRRNPAQFETVWEILVEEWAWEPISDAEWKKLTNQVRPAAAASSAPSFVASPVATPPPFQAPALTPHFVGRVEILTQAAALLTQSAQPVVALVGMGGVGKTTLATQIAHHLRAGFGDGVLWAHTQVSTPLDILNSWARAFGYDYSSLHDVESCAAALRSALAEKHLLVILDNVESVQAVRPLFLGGPCCAVLLTTRSEDVAAALGSQVLALAELAPAEGMQLLTNLLGAERIASAPTDAATICQLVHHLPLAVEIIGQLLAARSRRPLAQMAQRLQDVQYRLDLQISDRDVRTSFLVSWEALDAAHRRVFTHLALFGGRSLTAAALAAVLEDELDEVIEQLDTLVARSLVSAVEGDRYRQHPLLADFAREQLGDAPEPWQRLAASQLGFARQHGQNFAALEPEWDNLMAGMETAHRLQQWQSVIDYADTLTEPWFTRARYTQARQGYAWAVAAAEMLQCENSRRADILIRWGESCIEQSDFATAQTLLTDALALYTNAHNHAGIATAQFHLARIAMEWGEYEEAEEFLSNSKQMRESLADTAGIAATLYRLARLYYYTGGDDQSLTLCRQALSLLQKIEDERSMLPALRLAATIIANQDCELSEARLYCEQALQIARKLQHLDELAATYCLLATIERREKLLNQARIHADQGAALYQQIGDRKSEATALYLASLIEETREKIHEGLILALRSLTLLKTIGPYTFEIVRVMAHTGDLYIKMDDITKALAIWQAALQLAIEYHHPDAMEIQARFSTLSE